MNSHISRLFLFLIFSSGLLSCGSSPWKAEVVDVPDTIRQNQRVEFILRISNISRQQQLLPSRYVMERTIGARFVPITPNKPNPLQDGLLRSGDFATVRNSIDVCPPTYDAVMPRGTRDYRFTWKPEKDDIGEGIFVMELPITVGSHIERRMSVLK